jgi:flagellar basal-body rod protein FlgC
MSTISAIALSGLKATTLRVQAAASNIVNANSNGATPGAAGPAPYTPIEVHQSAIAHGGVEARLTPSLRSAVLSYDPAAPYADAQGYVARPDIDLVDETVGLLSARHDFAANLAVVRTEATMMDALLNMKV